MLERLGGEVELQRQVSGAHEGLIDVLERRALDGVAAIDDQIIRIGCALGADQRRDFGEPSIRRPVGVVVEGIQVAVEIGGGENGQLDALGGGGKTASQQGDESAG